MAGDGITIQKYADVLPGVTILVNGDPLVSGGAPFVSWSAVTDIGNRLIRAPSAAKARQVLGISAGTPAIVQPITNADSPFTPASAAVVVVLVDSSGGIVHVGPPSAFDGQILTIKDKVGAAGTHAITFTGPMASMVDRTSIDLVGGWLTFVQDPNTGNWSQIG